MVRIEIVGYDHPDSARLIDVLQREYVERYGEEDDTPVEPAEFRPPQGLFLLGYVDDRPVGSGGWRAREGDEPGLQDGDAEMKRLFVVPDARGRGLSRRLLAELEHTAAMAGRKRMVLETGTQQPEAIGLYTSAGYTAVDTFGLHRDDPLIRCFAKEL
ncbi:Acetyltransferase (GNAT) family protein [Saccharopolyspora kobensis]|uniref:Acetyltransferase (GNAT) family protein n=1 Tax=Saccharopolyspora kobensis TaxID=146035 RepID=A0A1H6ENE4_9PSEU|nr:Acetyltransferase (GNAT) family protein [Saccharopolyspora kobensis]SFE71480.1 Acetyltransferase (GNAT) family protein [Saccharopolyspora kobensis]